VPSDSQSQPSLRLATYNVEWFTNLFGRNDVVQSDDKWSSRYKIKRRDQLKAIADVIRAVNADAIMIIEAPDTGGDRHYVRALQNFAQANGLRQSLALSGFESHTRQEITLLYDPEVVDVHHNPKGPRSNGESFVRAPRFDTKFRFNFGVDGQRNVHTFSKPPLEVALIHKPSGKPLRLIGVHAKSKAVHGAEGAAAVKIAIENRTKQLAQCVWIRQRVEDHIAAGDSVIVLGDFNDGPKQDGLEAQFEKSGVEVVLGDASSPETHLKDPNAEIWLDPMQGWALSSARFYHAGLKWYVNTLLDYIMLSPDISERALWRIYHPFDDPKCFASDPLKQALLTASDHFPVCVDLTL